MTLSNPSSLGAMRMFRRNECLALVCAAMLLFFARAGFAQAPQPTSLSLSPATISQGQCYTITAGNGANMTLDVQYRLNNGAVQTIFGWPSLNAGGQAYICTTSATAVGTYTFTAIKNTLNSSWLTVSATVTVTGPPDFSLSVSPSSRTIDQGQSTSCTVSVSVVNGFNSSVSLSVSGLPAGASAAFTTNPVPAGGSTTLNLSAATTASTGSFTWTVTGTGGGLTRSSSATLAINPRQPTSLSFSASQGYAGKDCYVITVGNGANMIVDLQFTLNGVSQPVCSNTMNAAGQWSYCLNHNDTVGPYTFTAMKNRLRSDWVTLNPAVTYRVLPPQPTSLTISPTSVTAGQGSYRMTAGNGAAVTMDVQYRISGGPIQTTYGWPSLAAVSSGSPNGQVDIWTEVCTTPGNYVFTAVKNTLNTAWVTVSAPVTINPPAGPVIISATPASGARGTSVSVTINGSNLCGVSLATGWSGLTFANITADSAGSSASATFSIASSAAAGVATVTLSATGGSTAFSFTVTAPSLTLKKEYIYIGGKLAATEVP